MRMPGERTKNLTWMKNGLYALEEHTDFGHISFFLFLLVQLMSFIGVHFGLGYAISPWGRVEGFILLFDPVFVFAVRMNLIRMSLRGNYR